MKKRILSILLALCMCLTFVPVTVLAEDLPQQDNSIRAFSISPDTGNTTYCTYEFYVNGEKVDTQIVKNGDTLLEPQVEAQDGKVFTGWNPAISFGTVSGLTGENKTIRVDAVFADGYYVYFKDNTGRIIATKTGTTGQKITFEDVNFAVDTDEAITGWYTDKDCTSGNQVESVTIENSNITLYAKVETGYWITFESNGGSYVAPVFYATSAPAEEPAAPTKPGYTFAGWYTDAVLTTEADFSTIKANTTVYAKWTAANQTKYTVIHWQENVDDDKFSFKESETKTGTTGAQTNATAKTYEGFTAQTITQQTIKGDGSTIVNVYYKRNEYSIRFWPTNGSTTLTCGKEEHTHSWRNGCYRQICDGISLTHWFHTKSCYDLRTPICGKEEHTHDSSCYGTIALCTITAKYGANISDQWPARNNGSTNWATQENGYGPYQAGIDVMPLGGGNFYVPRSESSSSASASYYVEVLEGEEGITVNGRKYKLHHTDTVMMSNPSITWDEDFYNITGFTRNETDSTREGKAYNGAKFYYYRNSYDLVFISGGKTVKTESVKYQASIADYASYKPGNAPAGMEDYVFAGWYASQECTGDAYVFTGKTMPAQSITLYAKWVAPTYTVTVYDQNGNEIDEITVSKGDTVTDWLSTQKNKITLDTGDSFLGWTINRGLPFNPGTKITTNYELYAKVGNSTGYSVTYNANGGTGSVTDTEKYAKGAEATVMSNSFTNDGKVFLSWNTKANGTGTTYYPNSTVKITGNVTLYAQWGDKASTVQLTYKANGGSGDDITDVEIPNNKQVTLRDENTFTRTGYHFTGWNTEANGTGTSFSAGASARVDNLGSGNVLYAQWAPNTNTKYTVEFYYQDGDSYRLDHSDPRTGTTDTTVSVTDVDKADKENGKYVYDTTAANVESGKVAADGSLVLKLYFKLNQADVTVNYYWNETTNKVATSKTLPAQTVGSVITTETAIAIEGYTALPNQTCSLTVGADASKNVINFYYYKNVELTANSKTETYDGTEKSVSGFTVAPAGADFSAITVGTEGTDAGTYPAEFAAGTEGTVDATQKYIVTEATDGKLVITPVATQVTVTIKGNTKSETYDGIEKTVTGYEVVSISNPLYKESDFTLKQGATNTVTKINAGTYPMGLDFQNISKNFTNVKFDVTDGSLEIKQRNVTITGESASKTYNSKVQQITGITVEGLVEGHSYAGLTYLAEGKDAGKYDGSFSGRLIITDANNTNVTDNYNVKTVAGVLTITRSYRPSTPSTPSTPVTSVKTGDMGIALYAMTSLLSLSGAVAIVKKRKEDEK